MSVPGFSPDHQVPRNGVIPYSATSELELKIKNGVIPNSAKGRERDLTLIIHQQQRKRDYHLRYDQWV